MIAFGISLDLWIQSFFIFSLILFLFFLLLLLFLFFIFHLQFCLSLFFYLLNKHMEIQYTIIYKYITNPTGICLLKTKRHRHQDKVRSTLKVNNKDTRTTSNAVVLMYSLSAPNTLHTLHQHPHLQLWKCNCRLRINKEQLAIYT